MKTGNDTNMTVEVWIRNWQREYKSYIKESTFATYSVAIENHILPYFGRKRIKDIRHDDNQGIHFISFTKEEKNGSGYLAFKTIKDIMVLWIGILERAEQKGYIRLEKRQYQYPVSGADRAHGAGGNCLTLPEEYEIIKCLKTQKSLKSLGIALALATGMRIGEICALQWNCIDLSERLVHVKQTLQRIYTKENGTGKSKVIITAPKSLHSNRYIPLPENYCCILKKYQAEPTAYLLTGSKDKFIEPRTLREYYNRLMESNGTKYVTFHGLRHTFATRLVETGCDYKTISELLGHADINTTFRTYVHSDMDKKRQFVEKAGNIIEMG